MKKRLWAAALVPVLVLTAFQQEPAGKRIKRLVPEQAARMAKAIEAVVSPEMAGGLTLRLWGVDSLIADPVAIHIDDQGHLFYNRTKRRKKTELDIRQHPDWEIASIRMQTVEDRRDFLRRVLSPANSDKNLWLKDLNGDGSHDWRDMTVAKEQVYRVEDTNGDGVADLSLLVADDFHEEVSDVGGSVLTHGRDMFVTVAPDLWRLRDKNGDGIMDEKHAISHGYGVHIGFGGHNMSGLELGPDGRIYWQIGDIGFNGTGPDGKKWEHPNSGVIVRANPDGSDFEVFAYGVRNTHEFAFDEYGNLISQDNDGDHPGEQERLVYLVDGSDTGWRTNWQFGKYRDPDNNTYKVWMDEKLHLPRFEGQAAYILPAIANFVSGPTGFLYNPGTALSPKYRNTFFVGEFVGSPARSGIHAFKLKAKGASFELTAQQKIMGGVLATGLDFGPDGAMYVADWINGWDTKDHGRIWKLDDPAGANWAERQRTQALLAQDLSQHNDKELGELLKNPDMRVRRKAQFALAGRGARGAAVFRKSIRQKAHQLARVHGIWGLSQLARQDQSYARPLLALLHDKDPEIRAQAARWLGDMRYAAAGKALLPLLQDPNSRARFFAAEALGRIAYEPAIQPLIRMLQDNDDQDAYLRHAGSLALARIGKPGPLVALASHPSRALRLAAVVALRRLRHPGIASFLADTDELVVTEAARAINDDLSIPEALPALGKLLATTRFRDEALIRRAINANLRVGSAEALQHLLSYAGQESAPASLRAEAIDALSTWAKPSVLDRVDGRYRGIIRRDLAGVQSQAAGPLTALLSSPALPVRLSTVKAMSRLQIQAGAASLLARLKHDPDAQLRVEALRALAAMEARQTAQAIGQALSDQQKSVRVAALDLLAKTNMPPQRMVALLSEVIHTRTTEEKQAALLTLGHLPVQHSQQVFRQLLASLAAGKLAPEVHLELEEAIASTRSPQLMARYQALAAGLPTGAAFKGSLYGGEAELGRRIFFRHQTAQCIRCHSYDDLGGNAGPRLNGVASRLSRQQLLEALIQPSARLAPGFGMVTLTLKNGKTLSGILQEETDTALALKAGDQPNTVIRKDQIAERSNGASSMPDMKYLLTKREIRDVVAFLATMREGD